MDNFHRTQLRLGALSLMLAALLTIGGLYLRGPLILDVADERAFAQSVASPHNAIAEILLPLSLIVQIFGFLGIHLFLDAPGIRKTAFWGMVLSVFGNGLFLPYAGVFAFAIPAVGKLYLEGNVATIQVAELVLAPGAGFAYLIASACALTIGALLFAFAMWKTKGLPRWLPLVYSAQTLCLSFGASLGYSFEITGGIFLLASSLALAIVMW